MASKYMEPRPIRMAYIRRYLSAVCTESEVKTTELNILLHLQWAITVHTPMDVICATLQLIPSAPIQAAIREQAERVCFLALAGTLHARMRAHVQHV